MAKAKVVSIQVGGVANVKSLEGACRELIRQAQEFEIRRTKICFVIKLPTGEQKQITIRDEDDETVAYGDLEGLPSMVDYAKEMMKEGQL